jgi:hypothetical protein
MLCRPVGLLCVEYQQPLLHMSKLAHGADVLCRAVLCYAGLLVFCVLNITSPFLHLTKLANTLEILTVLMLCCAVLCCAGLLVFCVLNISSPLLHLSKLANTLEMQRSKTLVFAGFAFVFFATRVLLFPYVIVKA